VQQERHVGRPGAARTRAGAAAAAAARAEAAQEAAPKSLQQQRQGQLSWPELSPLGVPGRAGVWECAASSRRMPGDRQHMRLPGTAQAQQAQQALQLPCSAAAAAAAPQQVVQGAVAAR
jgi:hypothetical protein